MPRLIKANWGLKAHTEVGNEVFCLTWVDNNTVQLMTTAYSISDIDNTHYLHPNKRHQIRANSVKKVPRPYLPSTTAHSTLIDQSDRMGLPLPSPIRQYNLHMGGQMAMRSSVPHIVWIGGHRNIGGLYLLSCTMMRA